MCRLARYCVLKNCLSVSSPLPRSILLHQWQGGFQPHRLSQAFEETEVRIGTSRTQSLSEESSWIKQLALPISNICSTETLVGTVFTLAASGMLMTVSHTCESSTRLHLCQHLLTKQLLFHQAKQSMNMKGATEGKCQSWFSRTCQETYKVSF